MKRCTKCQRVKRRNQFNRETRQKDGLRNWCRKCLRKYFLDWVAHPKNKDHLARSIRISFIKRTYGVTIKWFKTHSKNGCESCRSFPKRSLHIDHDHATGKARGVLCYRCNHILGLAGDDPKVLANLRRYLTKSK